MNMENKDLPEHLTGRVKSAPIDFARAKQFMKRAAKDLETARTLESRDPEVAYQIVYESMFHAGLALMSVTGLRPEIKGKHKTVVDYTAYILGDRFKAKWEFYDRMRRRRHQFIYEPLSAPCTEKELGEAHALAQSFLVLITEKLKAADKQKRFNF